MDIRIPQFFLLPGFHSRVLDLRKLIEDKGLTQSEAAKELGVSQSRISDLVRGKWEKFSLEMLVTLATRVGIRVTLHLAA
jgi:predicted XRE-type DNA-binding protein